MNKPTLTLFAACILLSLSACESISDREKMPLRTMGVSEGPERVFDQPVGDLLPQLKGAVATNANGRVGPELVFWSYRLVDGRDALFYACAELEGVNCAARAQNICPARAKPTMLVDSVASGEVRELNCRAVGSVGVGDIRPNCDDTDFESPLIIGLAACP